MSATPELSDEQALIDKLRALGGEANNGTLRDELGWEFDRYWAARNRLLENGRVQKAHGGPGGKTVLSPTELHPEAPEVPQAAEAGETPDEYIDEGALYAPMLREIESNWILDEGYDRSICRKTAAQGKRDTGGKWTRPDISVIAVQKFKFLPGSVFDIISFEIKPKGSISVEGVFEALAHRQYTTRAYALFHISSAQFDDERESQRILALAEQHGVGLILADDPGKYDSWVERVRGRRWSPDPTDLNDFIQRVFELDPKFRTIG